MDFEQLTRKRLIYQDDADKVLAHEIDLAQGAYANQRLLGNARTAWDIKEQLTRELRQAKTELKGELCAMAHRWRSVRRALKILDLPIDWSPWPKLNYLSHDEAVGDLMKVHRERLRDRLDRLKDRNRATSAS